MARPKNTDAPDTTRPHELTVGMIDRLACPAGKQQAFLRDAKAPSLRVRVTAAGAKSYVFEAKLNRQTIRRTIGDVRSWSIDQARQEANRLRVTLDTGVDPREADKQQAVERAHQAAATAAREVLVRAAWDAYLIERKEHWSPRHYSDHVQLARPGGHKATRGTRGTGVTIAGPLHELLDRPLHQVTSQVIEAWAAKHGKDRPTVARLALRQFKAFLNWCATNDDYRQAVASTNPASSRKARQALGKPGKRQDALLKEQLPAWFTAVQALGNPTIAAYLQTVLLTGARPGEVITMRWADLNVKWRGLTMRDKVEGDRVIPLTPYVHTLLRALPRRGPWVFASAPRAKEPDKPSAPISSPNAAMDKACAVAGIDGLTLHGLRRSFKSLSEWLELPAGVVAQLMGHKPSATAEKHYTIRPLDLLRIHHERYEAWILEQAGVPTPGSISSRSAVPLPE